MDTSVMLQTTDTVQWHALISKATAAGRCSLDPSLENYLVLTLVRTFGAGGLLQSADALEQACHGADDVAEGPDLREVGDECLLLSGLFPERVAPHQVPISYFIRMGERAYLELAELERDDFYRRLSSQFVVLVDVLQRMRELDTGQSCLEPLQAFELWTDTRSQHAWDTLTRCGQVFLLRPTRCTYH